MLGLLSLAAVVIAARAGRLDPAIPERLSRLMLLEKVEWEESGSANLSARVSQELLGNVSQLRPGNEILKIDLEDLEKRLLAIPWIESVQIRRKLPSTLSVRYTVHHARALGLRKGRLWSLSSTGRWIAPIEGPREQSDPTLDLPVMVREESVEEEMAWLDALEKELSPFLLQIHEIASAPGSRVSALTEVRFPSRAVKILILARGKPNPVSLDRLKHVVQYLIKNNILVSSIDIGSGKKAVASVGKRP